MRKLFWFIAYLSVLVGIYVKVKWISISELNSTHAKSADAFYQLFPPILLIIVALFAVLSLYFFIRNFKNKQAAPVRILNTACIAVLSGYLFLEVWQYL